jgi:hypothetical protein
MVTQVQAGWVTNSVVSMMLCNHITLTENAAQQASGKVQSSKITQSTMSIKQAHCHCS